MTRCLLKNNRSSLLKIPPLTSTSTLRLAANCLWEQDRKFFYKMLRDFLAVYGDKKSI